MLKSTPFRSSAIARRLRRSRLEQLERRLLLATDFPELLRDINVLVPSSGPTEFVQSGDQIFISADDGIHGHELLVTDGVSSPKLVKDIRSGFSGSSPSQLIDVDGILYFVADDGLNGRELWKSDGTEAGTMLVADIFPDGNSNPGSLTVANLEGGAKLFFTAESPDAGVELWKADESGASMVVDLWSGDDEDGNPNHALPQHLTFWPEHLNDDLELVAPALFFSAETESLGRELWQTAIVGDNTTTTLVKNIFPDEVDLEPNSSDPSGLVLFKNRIYFAAEGAEFDSEDNLVGEGTELWRTDGTASGTELVTDIRPGFSESNGVQIPMSSGPRSLTVHNSGLYFSAFDNSVGRELWRFDGGSESDPTLVRNIRGGALSSSPDNLTSTDGFLFFTADGGQGKELWRTDGTFDETTITRDIRPGSGTSLLFTQGFEAFGSSIIFGADDGTLGPEVWISDGSLDGTRILKEIQFGRNSSNVPSGYTTVGDKVYFEASGQIWKSDGTGAGTERLAPDTPATLGSIEESFEQVGPSVFAQANGLLFFAADDGQNGTELWKSDGTTLGTTMVTDLAPGTSITFPGSVIETPNSSSPQELTAVGDKVFFRLETNSQLMVSDGSEAGTTGLGGLIASDLTPFLGKLFFAGQTSETGEELFMSDGTIEGTTIVREIAPETASSRPEQLTVVGNQLFFVADGGNGNELWVTDGTAEGTTEFNIADGFGSYPGSLTPVGDRVFFHADDGVNGRELWVSDGTVAGTMLVRDIREGDNDFQGSNPIPLAGINNTLLFFADDRVSGQKLWKTDGTTTGTVVIKDIWTDVDEEEFFTGEFTGTDGLVAVHNGKVVFAADDGVSGTELWTSDGTAAGTVMLVDLFPGEDDGFPTELTVIGDQLFFAANEEDPIFPGLFGGRELWVSDGTADGTCSCFELNGVNNSGSDPRSLAAIGGSLYFVANDGIHGDEVWTTSLRLKADDHLFEVLARDIAYRDSLSAGADDIKVGDEINLAAIGYDNNEFVFTVDLVIHDDPADDDDDESTGFDAYGLVADNTDPILLIRGSLGIDDFFSDLMPDGIGVNQFDANKAEVFQWLDDNSLPNHYVSVTGHSLGGALTQLVAAAYTSMGRKLAQVVTFNAPGISEDRAAGFVPDNVERVMHYVTNGDPVSLAGEQFIDGRWRRSNFDDLWIIHNHQYPVLVDYTIADDAETPEIETRPRSESLTFTEYEDTNWLNSPVYFHTDSDYFFWLAVIQVIVSTTPELQSFETLPGRLIFRSTTEAGRQTIGHFVADHQTEIDEAIAVVTCEATDTRVTAPDIDLTLLGLLEIEATGLAAYCAAGSPNELRLQGQVTLPQINNATADFSGPGNYIGLGENGLIKQGRLSIDVLPLLPGFWSLRNLFVDIRDATNEIEAGGTLQLPTGITVEASLGFLEGNFNKVSVKVPGPRDPEPPNQPLGNTGIFLQRIDGTVDHVSTSDPAPISFDGVLGATGGPVVTVSLPSWAGGTLSGSLIDLTVNGLLDKNHIDAGGTLSIIEGVATVNGQVEVNWNEGFVEASGALNVLDGLITADGSFRADSNLDINTFADATFGIPDAIPLIGGYDAVSGKFALDYSNDSTSANDFVAAWTTFDFGFLGEANLGFRLFLDGSFDTIGAEEIAEIVPPSEGEQAGSSTSYAIDADTNWALFSAEWDAGATDRTIVLTTPSGETITEADLANRNDIAIVDDLSGDMRRVVVVEQPESGQWTVAISDDSSLTNLCFHAYVHNEIPVVQVQAADGINGAPVEITYNATDPDSDAHVSLFYDTDNQGFDGVRIVGGLAEDDDSYTWTPNPLVSGEYYLYAMIDDGINPVEITYADQPISITPPPQRATVYLPVDGGVFEAFSENSELVVRRQGGEELFRSPESSLLGVDIVGVANVDDSVRADFSGLSIPILLDGGHSGTNLFSISGEGRSIDLTQDNLVLRNVNLIDITGSGDNQLTVSPEEVMNQSLDTSTLQIRHNEGDAVHYAGDGWEVQPPIFVDGQQWHVVTNGEARVETVNTLSFLNPLESTDVNLSGETSPIDALQIINYLARFPSGSVDLNQPTSFGELPERYYDVNGSGTASAIDVLLVINFISRNLNAEPEYTSDFVSPPTRLTSMAAKVERDQVTSDSESTAETIFETKPGNADSVRVLTARVVDPTKSLALEQTNEDVSNSSDWELAVDQLMKTTL